MKTLSSTRTATINRLLWRVHELDPAWAPPAQSLDLAKHQQSLQVSWSLTQHFRGIRGRARPEGVTVRGWREVADEVFVRSYDHLDINICVVRGGQELLLVDSRSTPAEAAELADDLTAFAPARVRVLLNTHAHFDHTFGNQQFARGPGPR